jgi:hypothetical protein
MRIALLAAVLVMGVSCSGRSSDDKDVGSRTAAAPAASAQPDRQSSRHAPSSQ